VQEVGVVDEEDGLDAALVDEFGGGALDVGEQGAAQAGAQAELGGQYAVERGRGSFRIACGEWGRPG